MQVSRDNIRHLLKEVFGLGCSQRKTVLPDLHGSYRPIKNEPDGRNGTNSGKTVECLVAKTGRGLIYGCERSGRLRLRYHARERLSGRCNYNSIGWTGPEYRLKHSSVETQRSRWAPGLGMLLVGLGTSYESGDDRGIKRCFKSSCAVAILG